MQQLFLGLIWSLRSLTQEGKGTNVDGWFTLALLHSRKAY
jgi:hypothetical protein